MSNTIDPPRPQDPPGGHPQQPDPAQTGAGQLAAIERNIATIAQHLTRQQQRYEANTELREQLDSLKRQLAGQQHLGLAVAIYESLNSLEQISDLDDDTRNHISNPLTRALEQFGFRINTRSGAQFDPAFHEQEGSLVGEAIAGGIPVVDRVIKPSLELEGLPVIKATVTVKHSKENQ